MHGHSKLAVCWPQQKSVHIVWWQSVLMVLRLHHPKGHGCASALAMAHSGCLLCDAGGQGDLLMTSEHTAYAVCCNAACTCCNAAAPHNLLGVWVRGSRRLHRLPI